MPTEPSKHPPNTLDDERAAAFRWAASVRARRAELRRELSSGERTLGDVLRGADPSADGAVKVLFVLESLPGARKVTTRRRLADLGIAGAAQLRDLSAAERDLLQREFPVTGSGFEGSAS